MKTFKAAGILFLFFSVVLGLLYPFAMTGIAQLFFPHAANGSMIIQDGKIVGSELIGQRFTQEMYFHGRPSAVNYDGGGSGASNYGPSEPKWHDLISERVTTIRAINALAPDDTIPVDCVTASASGLDPHLSLASAMLQVPRIANVRKLDETALRSLIVTQSENLVLSAPYVNVLTLNLALDTLNPQ